MIEKIGNAVVYFNPINDEAIQLNEKESLILSDIYKNGGFDLTDGDNLLPPKFKDVLQSIVSEWSTFLTSNLKEKPSEVELEFSLGFSQKANIWVIGVKGEQKVTVKLKWK